MYSSNAAIYDALEWNAPEPISGLPHSLTLFATADGNRWRIDRRFPNGLPARYTMPRAAGGQYVIELGSSPADEASWVARIEAPSGGVVERARSAVASGVERARSEARGEAKPVLLIALGLLAWKVFS